ncbi:MAG: TRAP transporter small permease subunit [Ectothiorhodospiraceae bacterium]|nr:TRAP transporter small permease subunit [Ectothiorhodospiraceae bacterium]MCH8503203.1 TRAP transporter small permease subunit [Ectothiorhodospiraceae bacterium]
MNALLLLGRVLDGFVEAVGRIALWLVLALILLVAFNVMARYGFRYSRVPLQELEWHILAAIAMFGAVFTYQQDEMVRVDVFHAHYPAWLKELLDLVVALLIVLPFAAFMAYLGYRYGAHSFRIGEGSPNPGGLPYRFIVKSFIGVGFGLLTLQGLAVVLRKSVRLITGEYRQTVRH